MIRMMMIGGDDGDNEIEEASPNGNKNEKKNGQEGGMREKRAVCSHWSRGVCKKDHDKCENDHPQLCGKILRFGICTEKEECKKYHPKMFVIRGIQEYANLEKGVISGIKQKCQRT